MAKESCTYILRSGKGRVLKRFRSRTAAMSYTRKIAKKNKSRDYHLSSECKVQRVEKDTLLDCRYGDGFCKQRG